jgi:hypothetical protein
MEKFSKCLIFQEAISYSMKYEFLDYQAYTYFNNNVIIINQ